MPIRVLIADDHPLVRDGLRFTIERSHAGIVVAAEATDGEDALRLAATQHIDVFILDITMPRLNGLNAALELLRRQPKANVILLSFQTSRAVVEESLRTGVRGYLTKETASSHVVEAVQKVYAGHRYLSPDVRGFLPAAPRRSNAGHRHARNVVRLTACERRVLQLIAEGLSAKEIAGSLHRAVETIRAHRKNIMAKFDIHKQADLVRFAVREGIAKL